MPKGGGRAADREAALPFYWRIEGNRMRESLLASEEGQDLVEFSLLLAFVVFAGAASYLGMAESINIIWGVVNGRLAEANQVIN